MSKLSDQTKEELFNALEGKNSGVFVINGKIVSIEVENIEPIDEIIQEIDVAQEIDDYPELKASLQRYVDHPDMKRYSANELKEKRSGKRK